MARHDVPLDFSLGPGSGGRRAGVSWLPHNLRDATEAVKCPALNQTQAEPSLLPRSPASSLTTLGPRAVLPGPTGLHWFRSLPSYWAWFVGQLIIKACQAQ